MKKMPSDRAGGGEGNSQRVFSYWLLKCSNHLSEVDRRVLEKAFSVDCSNSTEMTQKDGQYVMFY